MCAGRWLPPVALLTLLVTTGCEESLPPFPEPSIELEAIINVSDFIATANLGEEGPGPFGVDVRNMSNPEGVGAFYLAPPFTISAWVDVHHAKDPSRHITLGRKVLFSEPDQRLDPGQTVRVELPFPLQDADGFPWNFFDPSVAAHNLVFQGTVRIPEYDLVIRTPSRQMTFIYGEGATRH